MRFSPPLFLVLSACNAAPRFSEPFGPNQLRFVEEEALVGAPMAMGTSSAVVFDSLVEGTTVVSSDPSVIAVGEVQYEPSYGLYFASTYASGPGASVLSLRDPNGIELEAHPITVGIPDRLELHSSTDMYLHQADTQVQELVLLADGEATFNVRLFEGEQRLGGVGVVTINGSNNLWVQHSETHVDAHREWIRLMSGAPGEHRLSLRVGEQAMADWTLRVVEPDEIASLTIAEQQAGDPWPGDTRYVAAVAHTADGDRVYGVDADWLANGRSIRSGASGDMYLYVHSEDAEEQFTAVVGDLRVSRTLPADHGFVTSSNELGCDTTSGARWLGLLAFPLVLSRRRTS